MQLTFAAVARSAHVRESIERFCNRLGGATALEISLRPLSSYGSLLDEECLNVPALAWAPPLIAVELEQRARAAVLVAVTRSTRATYHSALFCSSASRVQQLGDLTGTRVAWVSRESASGYFVPRWHLKSIGIPVTECFSQELFCESHDEVARAVLNGEADVGATHVALEPVSGQLARAPWLSLGAAASSVRVLLLVGPIPGDVIVASRAVPLGVRRRLTAALLSMQQSSIDTAFDATRFEPVTESHLGLLKRLYA